MIYLGDIGTVIEVTVEEDGTAVDISAATSKQILFQHDETYNKVDADFTTDGTDGKIQYTLVDGDIDAAGRWLVQACITTAAGTWYTGITSFDVGAILYGWTYTPPAP